MTSLDRLSEPGNRGLILLASGFITLFIAASDWLTKPYLSLGFFYLFPIMLAAAFLPRWCIVLYAFLCAGLSDRFSSLEHSNIRLAFEALALNGCGLFAAELIGNRRLISAAQARFRALVETSPAAIVTVDERGLITAANDAAANLLNPLNGSLVGAPIAAFLPELHHGLRQERAPEFRASMQCRAHRANGEIFTADVWFSTFKEDSRARLAAIIADVTEETEAASGASSSGDPNLSPREIEVIRLLVQGLPNREIANRISLSERTVKNTLQQLFAKTGVRNRAQLVAVALEQYRRLL